MSGRWSDVGRILGAALLVGGCAAPGFRPATAPTTPSTTTLTTLTTPATLSCDPAAADADRDGLSDPCELELARRFAPLLMASGRGCSRVEHEDGARPGGGYHYVVARGDDGLRIAYLPGYFRDCGWSGAKCGMPWLDCSPHAGDSETIVLDLVEADGGWVTAGVFLSAHCFGRSSGSCRWYRGDELDRFAWLDGGRTAPVVWVADGRNANYPTRAACDRGHWLVDSCDDPRSPYRFPVHADGNIGSRTAPAIDGGCVSAAAVDRDGSHTAAGAVECFWDPDARFRGWQAEAAGVTGYSRYLSEIVGL